MQTVVVEPAAAVADGHVGWVGVLDRHGSHGPHGSGAAAYGEGMSLPVGNPALAPFGTTIFATMSALAMEHGAINLGQGFPDTDGPSDVLDAAVAAIRGGRNQ